MRMRTRKRRGKKGERTTTRKNLMTKVRKGL
jgi:hypothetical protein